MASFETRLRGKITLDSILIFAKILTVVSFELETRLHGKITLDSILVVVKFLTVVSFETRATNVSTNELSKAIAKMSR